MRVAVLLLVAAGCDAATARPADAGPDGGVPFFQAVAGAPDVDFFAVAGSSPTNVVVVGQRGTIARWNGTSLTVEESGTTADLRGVAVPADDVAWAVGDHGTVVRWNGRHWAVQETGLLADPDGGADAQDGGARLPDPLLDAVWSDGEHMIAVGAKGAAIGFDASWHVIATDSLDDLYALASDAKSLFAVGTLGTVAKYDGKAFHRMAVPRFSKTLAGATAGPGGTFLVGLGGAMFAVSRADGSLAQLMGLPSVFLRGVAAPAGGDVFAVGFDATVLRVRGMDVHAYTDVPDRSYLGVWASSATDVWVVGASGTVLRSNPRALPDGGDGQGGDASAMVDGGGAG